MDAVHRNDDGFDFSRKKDSDSSAFSFPSEKVSLTNEKEPSTPVESKHLEERTPENNSGVTDISPVVLPNLTLMMAKSSENSEHSQQDSQELSNGHDEKLKPCIPSGKTFGELLQQSEELPDTVPLQNSEEKDVNPEKSCDEKFGDTQVLHQEDDKMNETQDEKKTGEESINKKITEDTIEETQDIFASQRTSNDPVSSTPNQMEEDKKEELNHNDEEKLKNESSMDSSRESFHLTYGGPPKKLNMDKSPDPDIGKNVSSSCDAELSQNLNLQLSESQFLVSDNNTENEGDEDSNQTEKEEENSRIGKEDENSRISKGDENSRISKDEENSRISKDDENSRISKDEENSRISKDDENSRISREDENSRISKEDENSRISREDENSRISDKDSLGKSSEELTKLSSESESNEPPEEKMDIDESDTQVITDDSDTQVISDEPESKETTNEPEVIDICDDSKDVEMEGDNLSKEEDPVELETKETGSGAKEAGLRPGSETEEVHHTDSKESDETPEKSDAEEKADNEGSDRLVQVESEKNKQEQQEDSPVEAKTQIPEPKDEVKVEEVGEISDKPANNKANQEIKETPEEQNTKKPHHNCCPCVEDYETKLNSIKEHLINISSEINNYMTTKTKNMKKLNTCLSLLKEINTRIGDENLDISEEVIEKQEEEENKKKSPLKRKSREVKPLKNAGTPSKTDTPTRVKSLRKLLSPTKRNMRKSTASEASSENNIKRDGVAVFAKWPNSGWYYPGIVEGVVANQLKEAGSVTVCFYDGLRRDMKNINVLPAHVVPQGSIVCHLEDETEMSVIECEREKESSVNFTLVKQDKSKDVVRLTFNELAIRMSQMKIIKQSLDQLNPEVVPKTVHTVSLGQQSSKNELSSFSRQLDNLVCGRRSRGRSLLPSDKEEKTPKGTTGRDSTVAVDKPSDLQKVKDQCDSPQTPDTTTPSRSSAKRRASSICKTTPPSKRRISTRQITKKN